MLNLPDLTSTREILKDNSVQRYAPKGLSVDVIKGQSMLKIDGNSLNDFEREHVIPVFYKGTHKVHLIKCYSKLDGNYSIDTPDDLINLENFLDF